MIKILIPGIDFEIAKPDEPAKEREPPTAVEMVEAITPQAQAAGWTLERLQQYKESLALFMPAKIGTVYADWIETIILHSDGTFRGATRFYK